MLYQSLHLLICFFFPFLLLWESHYINICVFLNFIHRSEALHFCLQMCIYFCCSGFVINIDQNFSSLILLPVTLNVFSMIHIYYNNLKNAICNSEINQYKGKFIHNITITGGFNWEIVTFPWNLKIYCSILLMLLKIWNFVLQWNNLSFLRY